MYFITFFEWKGRGTGGRDGGGGIHNSHRRGKSPPSTTGKTGERKGKNELSFQLKLSLPRGMRTGREAEEDGRGRKSERGSKATKQTGKRTDKQRRE